jgi:hypothetical protein
LSPTAYTQGYQPFAFADFSGGINLRDKSDVVTDKEAIDLLNVTFNERGAIRQRDGYADLTTADLTNRVDSLAPFYNASGIKQLIAGCGTRLEALSTAGAVVASKTGLVGGPYSFARFAAPGSEFMYAANGADTLQRWDGSAWTAPTATVNGTAGQVMPKAGSITVTAAMAGTASGTNAANRLVATAYGTQTTAGPGGSTSTPSRVHFSNAGQPEIWETDGASGRGRNFLDLTPGDGEQIMAAVTWRELVFVFKETKFFVMWGESTAADGTPIFNFREIVNSTGLASKQAVAVGRDGVYFFNRRGVYHTAGNDPTLLSDKVSPLWSGDLDVYYQGSAINFAQIPLVRMAWHEEQLYVAIPTGTSTFNDRLLVYDTQHQWWTVYDIAASALAQFRRVDQDELHHGFATGANRVGHRNRGSTIDRTATTITSRWRSGWGDYGNSLQKTIRETKAWGSGAVTASFSTDFNGAQIASLTALFGISTNWPTTGTWADFITLNNGLWPGGGQINDVQLRRAVRGTAFSTQFANNPLSTTWSIHRVVRNLREIRGASVR